MQHYTRNMLVSNCFTNKHPLQGIFLYNKDKMKENMQDVNQSTFCQLKT